MEFKKIGFTSPIKSRVVNYSSTSQKPVRPDILRLSAALIIKGTEWGGGGYFKPFIPEVRPGIQDRPLPRCINLIHPIHSSVLGLARVT